MYEYMQNTSLLLCKNFISSKVEDYTTDHDLNGINRCKKKKNT